MSNDYSEYQLDCVQIRYVSHTRIASSADKEICVVVSPEDAIKILSAHLTQHAGDGANAQPQADTQARA